MVPEAGLEPVYACVKGMCVKPLHQRAIKSFNGAPKRSRTPNLWIRSQTLYPIELWALFKLVPRAGIEPARVSPPAGF